MKELLAIAVAGSLGTLSRWGVGRISSYLLPAEFPFATFIVNVLGCFAFGFIMQAVSLSDVFPRILKLALTVGFLGAFTTFSTFGFESYTFLKDGQWIHAFINISANMLLGLVALFLGMALANLTSPSIQ